MCGALVIDSMPPATTTVASPARISSAPIMAAFMAEPHILLTVVQGVALSRPAPSAAWRAGACPCPAERTQPMMRSSTSFAPTPACSSAALMATAPSCEAARELNLPCMAPMGVRLAPTMTIDSDIRASFRSGLCDGCCGLQTLEDGGDALPAADAHGDEPVTAARAREFVEALHGEDRARGADRVAQGHRAAVRVHLRRIEPEVAGHAHRLHREGFVGFDHVHVGGREAGLLEHLAHRRDRAD